MSGHLRGALLTLLLVLASGLVSAKAAELSVHRVLETKPEGLMLRYFQRIARETAAGHPAPPSLEAWEQRRAELRSRLWTSLGEFPLNDRPPLNARITGTIDRGDHRIEKVVYESLPGLYVTGLLYVPANVTRPVPAVICVNGHWPDAKATPDIQRRCVGLARIGVVAFCQDVIGTGERAAPPGSPHAGYHGTYRGAAPWIAGRSLLGYVMYECMRAVDYLESRSEVDPSRILATGASGGGNQSMFFAALDERLAGAIPVCSVSSYETHMGATACVCEALTHAMSYTNQWEILGLHAPRPLLCMAASRDVPVFLPREMFDTLGKVSDRVYRLYGAEDRVRGVEFDAPHSYNKEMRELLYKQVTQLLKGEDATEIVEPEDLPVASVDELRCGLPTGGETMQSLTFRRAKELIEAVPMPGTPEVWGDQRRSMRERLETDILRESPERSRAQRSQVRQQDWEGHRIEHWIIEPEPGIVVPLVLGFPGAQRAGRRPAVLIVDESGKAEAFDRGRIRELLKSGFIVAALDYRGAGETAGTVPELNYETVTPDYNLSNYSIMVGRPLAGMRVFDVRCVLDFIVERAEVDRSRIALTGRGMGGFIGLLTAVLDDRVGAVAIEEVLDTWAFSEEFNSIGLSYLLPRVLSVGDIMHLAACVAPRPMLVLNPVDGKRRPLDGARTEQLYPFARSVYTLSGQTGLLQVRRVEDEKTTGALAEWLSQQTRGSR